MATSPHRIRRLRLGITAPPEADGFALRQRLRALLDEALLPSLEGLFNEFAPEGEVVHVRRLELSATVRSVDELADILLEQLRRELAARVPRTRRGDGDGEASPARENPGSTAADGEAPTRRSGEAGLASTSHEASAGREAGHGESARPERPEVEVTGPAEPMSERPGIVAGQAPRAAGPGQRQAADRLAPDEALDRVERRSAAEERVRVLACYLETGALPWYATGDAAIRAAWAEAPEEELARAVAACAVGPGPRPRVILYFRLLQLLPEARWADVARALEPVSMEPEGPLAQVLVALAGPGALSRHARLWAAAVAMAATHVADARGDELAALLREPAGVGFTGAHLDIGAMPATVASFFARWPREAAPPAALLAEPTPPGSHPAASATPPRVGAPSAPTEPASAPGGDAGSRRESSPGAQADGVSRVPTPPPPPLPPSGATSAAAFARRPADEPAGLPARMAGLVLLHPFLPRFFENTGIKRPGQSTLDEAVLPRAAALLHACAAGTAVEPFEYDLGFIKLLLGLGPEEPLPVAAGLLRASDEEEVDGLLRAMTGHWSILKKTSPDGLRATFLMRGGLMRKVEGGWLLRVESSGFDVLLARLPWGIGTVRLPWMKKAIFTEWPTP